MRGYAKERGQDQYFANVALKFNLKLGGNNQLLDKQRLGIINEDKTMVVGIDVTHPSPGSSSRAPSIAGMVASVDRWLTQWPAVLRVQAGARQEMVTDLSDMLKSRLQPWKTKGYHQSLPENILVYRDGASEGQYDKVVNEELPRLRKACTVYPASDQKRGHPHFTIIIVGKRRRTRFYPTKETDADRSGNPKPGTIVDRGVTEARNWDFFLQAHAAIQGTARPGHYVVVLDEIFCARYAKTLTELPAELAVSIPPGGSLPCIPSHFLGNMHAHYYLALILFHRPILSFLDPNAADGQWKHHMMTCFSSAKTLCLLQEATLDSFGLTGLQCMQRGFSFSLYSGLSCIVIYLIAIVSPDPDFNTDAREFFTRHMRVLEKVMKAWSIPELEKQFNALREAFSADVQEPFVLKPTFPYGSHSSSPRASEPFRPVSHRSGSVDQHLDTHDAQQVSYTSHPITPPISAGPVDSKSDFPAVPSLVMMSQGTQAPGMLQSMPFTDQLGWNPTSIFE
ncbi:hypothetical protein NW759_016602 [Fusarium solani]|nr:hypothetical protein NW759_016602 [Fusarium solani]